MTTAALRMLYLRFTRALLALYSCSYLFFFACFAHMLYSCRSKRVMTSRFTRTLISLYLRFTHALLMLLLLGQRAGRQAAARIHPPC